jgi:hypothetical protein
MIKSATQNEVTINDARLIAMIMLKNAPSLITAESFEGLYNEAISEYQRMHTMLGREFSPSVELKEKVINRLKEILPSIEVMK